MESPSSSSDFQLWNQVRWLLGAALGACAVLMVWLLEGGWSLASLLCFALIASFFLNPSWSNRIPRFVHAASFPVAFIGFAADLALWRDPIPALLRLALFLLVYRACSPRKRRDDLQLLVLGLFVLIVCGIMTVSPFYIGFLCLFFFLGLGLLVVRTRLEAGEVAADAELFTGTLTWKALRTRLHNASHPLALAAWAALCVGTLLLAAVLFVIMPRFEATNSLLLDRLMGKRAATGFTDVVRFGDFDRIQEDTTVAFRADVRDKTSLPETPYWRMAVLDQYRDGAFSASTSLLATYFDPVASVSRIDGLRGRPRPPVIDATLYLEPGLGRYLPLTGRFKTLLFSDVHALRTSAPLQLITFPQESYALRAFKVSEMETGDRLPDPTYVERTGNANKTRRNTLFTEIDLPESQQQQLAATLASLFPDGPPADARTFSQTLTQWLRSRHAYSLSLERPSGSDDPLVLWLEGTAPGHCELFAGSFTLLARKAGFPARLVAGFLGGKWNEDYLIVRNSDAHAWCEIYDSAGGWLRVDPTNDLVAGLPGSPPRASIPDSAWTSQLDRLRMLWYRHVVNFDHASQAALAKSGLEATRRFSDIAAEWFKNGKSAFARLRALSWKHLLLYLGGFCLAAAFSVASGLGVVHLLRAVKRSRLPRTERTRAEAAGWLLRLQPFPEDANLLLKLRRIRFGPTEHWGDPRATFAESARALRRQNRNRAV